MDEWLKQVATAIGSGDRRNAPLLAYLIGRSRGDRTLDEIHEAVREALAG